MDIERVKLTLLRTHIAALKLGVRANGMHIESGPGIGKTEGVEQEVEMLASEIREPAGLVSEMLATYCGVDTRGFMLPVKGPDGSLETIWSMPAWYPKIGNMKVVEPNGTWHDIGEWNGPIPRVGVLFLDEFSQAEEDVKKSAAELIFKGRVGTTSLPKGWRVVAAGNRTSDRSGVMRELMHVINRRCLLKVDPSLPAWLDWVSRQPADNQPHYMTVSFASKNPGLVFRDKVPDGTDPFCTPRTLCLMDKDLRALRSDDDIAHDRMPMDDVAREVCAGWIGEGTAAQYFTHLKYSEQLPDIEDIEKDPMKAKLPSGRDAQMVCAYMLSHVVNEKNATNVLKYINRLHVELQVLAVQIIVKTNRLKEVAATPEYLKWITKNKDILIASNS